MLLGRIMSKESLVYRGLAARRTGTAQPAARSGRGPEARSRGPEPAKGAGLFGSRAWALIKRSLNLSTREQQLVRGVFDDYTDLAIALSLGISPHTVHTHFERLHLKLGVTDRAQLILRVLREFLILTALFDSRLPPVCPFRGSFRCPWRNNRPKARALAAAQAKALLKR